MEHFIKLCETCSLRVPQKTKPPLRPIVANVFFTRVQVSIFFCPKCFYYPLYRLLIDTRHLPHDGNKWILHIVDHWSKFNVAYPLPQKTAKKVTNALEKWIFPIFGLPTILHSDNGREFVNHLIEDVLATWPRAVQLVSGRRRHPQSQGLVEQAHYIHWKVPKLQSQHLILLPGLTGYHILSVSSALQMYISMLMHYIQCGIVMIMIM